ncbi:MAG: elongation factor 1-beta [Nanoarchaeota archaeon]|nr:elongation factor 1-beta [Nanoarchaeota archaeon]
MGDVGITIKIMPSSPEIDLEAVLNKIKEKYKIQDSKIEPIAFGLKSLTVLIIVPDKEGADTDPIQTYIQSVDGVESVEIVGVSLV